MVAVAVLATLAVILAALLAFVVVRNGDQDGDPPSTTIERATDSTGPATTAVDIEDLATDGGTFPDVAGLVTSEASAVIRASGFGVAVPAHCFDTVESQSPAAGAVADEGAVMSLRFAPCIVPDFIGLRLPEARRIVDEEFVIGLLINWPAHCDDLVLDQSLAAGTVVDPGTEIDLTLEQDCDG